MDKYLREPCPWRIINDSGTTFIIGAIGGSIFHSIKGFRNAPIGLGRKMLACLATVKKQSQITAGNCTVWGGIFSTIDCSLVYLRQKEDPWNTILSGALSKGIMTARNSIPAMAGAAFMGAIFFTLIEGIFIVMNHSQRQRFT